MKGKTKLQTTDLHCSSLDTLPLSTSTLTLCPFHKTCSNAGKNSFSQGQMLLALEQVLSCGEQVLSRAEQIFSAGHSSWPAADRITLDPTVKEIVCPQNDCAFC